MKNYGPHAAANIALHWREWFRNQQFDIAYQEGVCADLKEQVGRAKGEEQKRLFELWNELWDEKVENERRAIKVMESDCPIGFFKPSWEQAQVLNAWSPEFEPHACIEGYRSVCMFCGNRIGKTCVSVINTLLWLAPNDPEWSVFQEYEDESAKRRGRYRVFQRPHWSTWKRNGKMVYVFRSNDPPMEACEVWHGVENDIAWSDKVGKEYLKWAPKDWIGRRSDGGTAIFKQERRIESRFGHSITSKTFNADVQDWAGKAVRILNLDEGLSRALLTEGLMRIEAGGYLMWPYTPAEARNVGERSKVAYDVYQGKIPLVGKGRFFLDFSMQDAPEHVLPAVKKADDIARCLADGDKGRIRMMGGFFNSSPVVFANFGRERNVLPIEGAEVLLAIRGETVTRWVSEFGKMRADRLQWAFDRANIIRGMDEGLANPTACDWTAVLRTGEMVSFKEWQESGLSVSERCREIIDRSGNKLLCLNPDAHAERKRYREEREPKTGMVIRRTFADSKMFKRNPETPADDWTETYSRAGLRLERATNIGPAARCDYVNDMLRGRGDRKHLMDDDKPGCRGYVTRDCVLIIERFENYLWAQISAGQRAGEFTDKPESKDDHRIDALCYAWGSKLKWKDPVATPAAPVRRDRETGYVVR